MTENNVKGKTNRANPRLVDAVVRANLAFAPIPFCLASIAPSKLENVGNPRKIFPCLL